VASICPGDPAQRGALAPDLEGANLERGVAQAALKNANLREAYLAGPTCRVTSRTPIWKTPSSIGPTWPAPTSRARTWKGPPGGANLAERARRSARNGQLDRRRPARRRADARNLEEAVLAGVRAAQADFRNANLRGAT
jgi:uncharacterized protein YjbI with pentapeptide repeats